VGVHSSRRALIAADDRAPEAGSGLRAVRLAAIKDDIIRNLRQQSLSIHALASRHGIAAVYIRYLFEAEGTTFAKFVLVQRLDAAHAMLTEGHAAKSGISAIAFAVGFGNVAQFTRASRRRYGVKPTDLKRQTPPKRD
jgi:AraC-like DNA-binding protein